MTAHAAPPLARSALAAAVVACLLASCSSARTREGAGARSASAGGEERARVERVIRTRRDLSSGLKGVWSRLRGVDEEPLFVRPHGVAFLGDDLVVTDPAARAVLRLTPTGTLTRTAGPGFLEPVGVASCPEGILVTDSRAGRVAILGTDLSFRRWLAEGLERPTGIACAGGRVYVVETAAHRVAVLEDGHEVARIGRRGDRPGELNYPTAIAVGKDMLFVGDTLNARVQGFRLPSGQPATSFGALGDAPGEMPRLKGLAVDDTGRVWVSDALLDRVCLYEPDGRLLYVLGASGSAPGELSFPAGLATAPPGRLAVVDALNRRVQVFAVTTGRSESR